MNLFLDNCLSPRYAQSLHALSDNEGHKVCHLKDMFPRDATDLTWIRGLAHHGEDWTIVSGDSRILRTPQLKAEWLNAGLTAFFLEPTWMNLTYWEQAAALVRWWPHILNQAALVQQGAGFGVPFRQPHRFKQVR